MLDHTGFNVRDFERSKDFYLKALAPLGYRLLMEFGTVAGFGANGHPDLWIAQGAPQDPRVHIGFRAPSREAVDAFHSAALEAGGRDNGPPGLRPHYHANYYGAFVHDPDGHNIEAVCHLPD